jgi:YEATS domain-containing protein 4
MPAAASSKRVKNTRISRPFIIGSQSWTLTPENHPVPIPENHTKGWRVYVKGLDSGPDITTWLKKVQFKLHHTYADASRTIEAPPFQITETGYGEFDIELRLYFDSSSGEKAQYRQHRLRLEPFGSEENVRKQIADNMITAEQLEIVEFNEPSADFLAKLTAEDQFAHLQKKGGGSKGGGGGGRGAKGRKIEYEGGKEPSANLPERGNWSRAEEKRWLDTLALAHKNIDAMIEEENKKALERRQRLEAA